MPVEIVTLPARSDNYAYLLRDSATGQVAAIDAPEERAITRALAERGWGLDQIWITHHHDDHVQGLAGVLAEHPAEAVIGAAADAHRLPPLTRQVAEGDTLSLGNLEAQVIEVYGHTVGHIAFHVPGASVCFTADSLMALGCGRLFEGTPAQMWDAMQKLIALPADTVICSGHEYTASNAKFALSVDPDNAALISRAEAVFAARAEGRATVPSTLEDELATNPFLRPTDPGIRAHLGMPTAPDAEVFAEIRKRKDTF